MPSLRVPVYYDFASSICYIAHRVMERLQPDLRALDIELRWLPVDLTRFSIWNRGDVSQGVRSSNVQRVSRDLGVPLLAPAKWMDSRAAMAAALALGESDREAAWRERIWSAVYEQGRSLDDSDELERMARDLGLDLGTLVNDDWLNALQEQTERCVDSEVTGVPTFMLDGWPIGGIQVDDTMRDLLDRFAAKMRAEPRS